MGFLETVLIILYIIVSVTLIILALIQTKDDDGASGAIMGGSSGSSFYEKNKGRTKEGRLKRWTIILACVFGVLSIILGIIYV